MREGMSDMARGRKGQILMLALLVMFVGAVILAGLFQYMGSSLLLATRGEENAVNYYAADSGIEDALHWLQQGQEDEDLWAWNVGEEQWEREAYTLNYTNNADNNRAVDVIVKNNPSGCGDNCYSINSTATHNKSGASTRIISYVRTEPLEFYLFGDDAITSNCSVDIKNPGGHGNPVQGNVTYVCDVECDLDPNATKKCPDTDPDDGLDCCEQSVNGSMNYAPNGIDWWPETWAIAKYFKDQVDISKPFTGGVIDISVNSTIGPLYVEGDLVITSSVDATAMLNGTVYVTGQLQIGSGGPGSGPGDFTLDLHGQSIFVESNAEKPPEEAIVIGGKCTIAGSGAIFAIGDIAFKPFRSSSSTDFLLIMSLEGGVELEPGGNFYGSVVGYDDVYVAPNSDIIHTDSELWWRDLPNLDVSVVKILIYDIIDR